MKITLLPLDSRPCNYLFPVQLAAGSDITVAVPPLDIMDFYGTPSNHEEILAWLRSACFDSDALVLSVDQFVYGGLLASRSMTVPQSTVLDLLEDIKQLKLENPTLPIYLFNSIMRTTISTFNQEDQIWWEKVSAYSRAVSQAEYSTCAAKEALSLAEEIPEEVLETFLSARRRNHLVNQAALELVKCQVAEELVLLQEDAAPIGLHKLEQQKLINSAASGQISDRVHIHCGTDEIAAAFVCRLAAEQQGKLPDIYIEWLNPEQSAFTARYEDRPFSKNLSSYIKTCHLAADRTPEQSDIVMLIYPPKGEQQDLALDPYAEDFLYTAKELTGFCDRMTYWLAQGKKIALLDLYYTNGGETNLLQMLSERGLLQQLSGYSAWNTACNSLGTLLGQIMMLSISREGANQAFLYERFLDDWLYQAVVRPELNEALEQIGEDKWNIQNMTYANSLLQQFMKKALGGKLPKERIPPFTTRLYWPRTFEATNTLTLREEENL